jgi:acyl-CoA thioester hydrolase
LQFSRPDVITTIAMQQQDTAITPAIPSTPSLSHRLTLRVRYSETDQMGTFYNSRALEWFEVSRTELMRSIGLPYTQWESQGYMLPLVESHVNYRGRARYDDLLQLDVRMTMAGRASLRFEVTITHADSGQAVADGYTVHAITDPTGKATRPPRWLLERFR